MLQSEIAKHKKLFNPEFVFDGAENNNNNGHHEAANNNNNKRKKSKDDDEDGQEVGKLEEIASMLKNTKDHVRLKTSSAKKKVVDENDFFELPTDDKNGVKSASFEDMNISKPLIKALAKMGLTKPTNIQSAAIPTALMGKDICACAVTGSGKTLAFMLPALERLLYKPRFPQVTRVLVLTPTRELAVQICKVTRELSQFTTINTCLCAGGFDIKTQEAALRLGPDICIATPGRLIDHLTNTPCFNLEAVEILILDEADRMLDEYFIEQLKEVIRLCSKTHQTMLFSATMTDKVEDLVNVSLKRPVKIFLNENVDVTPLLKQEFVRLRDSTDKNREAILAALIQRRFNDRVIVFVRTKSDCHRICMLLNLLDIKAAELHGGLTQTQRLDKLQAFKDNELNVMVATDLAARGLDIMNVKTVINFSMPMTFKHYIHRVGRTARAQNSGRAISLVGESERWLVKDIVKSSKAPVKCRVIPPEIIEFYREKCGALRESIVGTLREEDNEKLIEKMEKDLSRAENKLKDNKKNKERESKISTNRQLSNSTIHKLFKKTPKLEKENKNDAKDDDQDDGGDEDDEDDDNGDDDDDDKKKNMKKKFNSTSVKSKSKVSISSSKKSFKKHSKKNKK